MQLLRARAAARVPRRARSPRHSRRPPFRLCEVMRGHAAEREPVDGVDDGFQPADVRSGAKAEVRTLRIPSADDAVAVLDGTLLPRSVCSCVVYVAPGTLCMLYFLTASFLCFCSVLCDRMIAEERTLLQSGASPPWGRIRLFFSFAFLNRSFSRFDLCLHPAKTPFRGVPLHIALFQNPFYAHCAHRTEHGTLFASTKGA